MHKNMTTVQKNEVMESRNMGEFQIATTKVLEGHWGCVDDFVDLHGAYEGLLCSVGADKTIRVWLDPTKSDIKFHPELILRGHSDTVTTVVQLRDERLCTGSKDGLIKIWNITNNWADGQCEKTMRGHKRGINVLKVPPSRPEFLVSGSDDNTVMIWDMRIFRYVCVLEGHSGPVLDVIELRNGKLCSASADQTLIMWTNLSPNAANRASAMMATTASTKGSGLPFSAGSMKAAGSAKQRLTAAQQLLAMAAAAPEELYRLESTMITRGHKAAVTCVIELQDGRICSCGADKVLKLWDPARYVCERTMEGHWAAVNWLVQLNNGLLCSCSDDGKVKLWHLTKFVKKSISTPDDYCLYTFSGHSGTVRKVKQLRDGSLCTCSDDNTVRLWHPTSIAPES